MEDELRDRARVVVADADRLLNRGEQFLDLIAQFFSAAFSGQLDHPGELVRTSPLAVCLPKRPRTLASYRDQLRSQAIAVRPQRGTGLTPLPVLARP